MTRLDDKFGQVHGTANAIASLSSECRQHFARSDFRDSIHCAFQKYNNLFHQALFFFLRLTHFDIKKNTLWCRCRKFSSWLCRPSHVVCHSYTLLRFSLINSLNKNALFHKVHHFSFLLYTYLSKNLSHGRFRLHLSWILQQNPFSKFSFPRQVYVFPAQRRQLHWLTALNIEQTFVVSKSLFLPKEKRTSFPFLILIWWALFNSILLFFHPFSTWNLFLIFLIFLLLIPNRKKTLSFTWEIISPKIYHILNCSSSTMPYRCLRCS